MINHFILKNIEKALNAYLALDPESKNKLVKLEGRTITIHLKMIDLTFQMSIEEDNIRIQSGEDLPSEFKISGTPLGLLNLAWAPNKNKHFFGDEITLSGNAEFAQEIIHLFDQIDIDWEEYLSKCIGDIPAHQVGLFSKKLIHWGKQAKHSILNNVSEYIHEEKSLFPPIEEMQDFYAGIDELRMDVDRLEKKIKGWVKNENI